METCANPGCSEPGTNRCAGCKMTPYCGPICQTAHWPTHKESCDGRLRKMGMDHLAKAKQFDRENNWLQSLRHSDLAATKLKLLKDRPLDDISSALNIRCDALGMMGRYREQLETAKEYYCLWNTKPTDVGAIDAAFALIRSCINNQEYADALLYASTLWEIINHKHDNKIPDDQRQYYIATGAYFLAKATQTGGIPPEKEKKAGQETIALARRALEIDTQLRGSDDDKVANNISILAEALSFFNRDIDDEEVLLLYERAKVIYTRKYGGTSSNVASTSNNIGVVYQNWAIRAKDANDLDRCATYLELSLSHYREAARICRAVGRVDKGKISEQNVIENEERLRQLEFIKAAAAAMTRG